MFDYLVIPDPQFPKFLKSKSLIDKDYGVAPPTFGTSSSGKGSVVYTVHPYHTKMPIETIAPYIRHFTREDDLVLDPFCGSGMTGIACLSMDRQAILVDVSPAATHISHSLITRINKTKLRNIVDQILSKSISLENDWYGTTCRRCGKRAIIAYVIWSVALRCSCGEILNLWDIAVDKRTGSVLRDAKCPKCETPVHRRKQERIGSFPVVTVYDCQGGCKPSRHEDEANADDKSLIARLSKLEVPWWSPPNLMMDVRKGERWGEQWRLGYHKDVFFVRDFFTPRAWLALSYLFSQISVADMGVRRHLFLAFTGSLPAVSRMVKYLPTRGGRSNTPGTLYIPTLSLEQNVFRVFDRRVKRLEEFAQWQVDHFGAFDSNRAYAVTGSASDLSFIPNETIDYVFTDPPFAENIQYAELNYLAEAWLQKFTPTKMEAVVSPARGQDSQHYWSIMSQALLEIRRVLKPKRYCSLVFHSTEPSNWQFLMKTIRSTPFELTTVGSIDKGQSGWNQLVSEYAANFDLVLHLRKGEISGDKSSSPMKNIDVRNLTVQLTRQHLLTKPATEKRTTAYIHSLLIRTLLVQGADVLIPSPKDVERNLQNTFAKRSRYWYLEDENPLLDDFN